MPRSRRSCKAGWWPGQHHRGSSGRPLGELTSGLAGVFLLFFAISGGVSAQNLLNIRIIDGEGAIHASGAKASRPIVVEITDETGRPLDGVAVSFRMPEEGPGASFPQGMKTDIRITGPDGKAMAHEFTANRIPGPFQIRVTAVKSDVRAGVIVGQYVSSAQVKSKQVRRGSSRKWIVLAAVSAAAGAGFAASSLSGSSGAVSQTRPATPAPPPTIGVPSISVGGPQ